MTVAQAVFDVAHGPPSATRVLVGDDAVAAVWAHRRALMERWQAELAG